MQFGPVEMADALGGLIGGGHGDEAVAAGARALGVGHHLGSNNLMREGVRGLIPTGATHAKKMHAVVLDSFLYYYQSMIRETWDKTLEKYLYWEKTRGGLTLPYLLKRVFRSVALVVEDRPLTQRFLPAVAATLAPAAAAQRKRLVNRHVMGFTEQWGDTLIHSLFSSFDSVLPSFSSELETKEKRQ